MVLSGAQADAGVSQMVNVTKSVGLLTALVLAESLSAAPPTPMLLEPGINRPGQDYRNFTLPKPDPGLCLAACDKEERCRAFTYVKPGLQGPSARCWLKHGIPASNQDECCVSGVKAPPKVAAATGTVSFGALEKNTNRGGFDFHSFNLAHADPSLCQAECAKNPRCKAFTYVKPGLQGASARCWLKHSVPPPDSHTCCVSGVKVIESSPGPASPAVVATPVEQIRKAPATPRRAEAETTSSGAHKQASLPAESSAAEPVAGLQSPPMVPPSSVPETTIEKTSPAATSQKPAADLRKEGDSAGQTALTAAQTEGMAPTGAPVSTAQIRVASLSPAQKSVIEYYGWPQTFSLMFYAGDAGGAAVRQETWNYHTAGIAYTFINGASGGHRAPLPDVPGAVYPDYRPIQFAAGMSVTQAFNALPAVVTYYREQMPEAGTATYWVDRLVMGFVDSRLVYVETRPRLPAAAEVAQ
jgi:hypothetical protein